MGDWRPLLGFVADQWGRRKPVLAGGIVLMLISGIGVVYLHQYLSTYVGGLLFGIGSGAEIIPYKMAKESNPDNVKGSAMGAMNFLVVSFSAFLAPASRFSNIPAASHSRCRRSIELTSSGAAR